MKPIVVVTGTRPEIIKMAPIIRALNKAKLPSVFVHCGQHYDYNMAQQFIENLELAKPDHWLDIKATSPGSQTGEILIKMDELLGEIDPSILLVEGDTNTVLSAALAANKRAHSPAGRRRPFARRARRKTRPRGESPANRENRRREGRFSGRTAQSPVSCHRAMYGSASCARWRHRGAGGTGQWAC